ncbi:hypothetical protein GEMRC1_005297 [Eukaryota sp. GEM-RC1]
MTKSSSTFLIHSTTKNPTNGQTCLQFQQSLLVLIHFHLIKRLCKSSEVIHDAPSLTLRSLKQEVSTFFKNVGHVSLYFFESSLLAVKMVFRTHTFHVVPNDFPQLYLFAAFFDAEVQSVFLHLKTINTMKELSAFSHVICGLKVTLANQNDLEFLNKTSFSLTIQSSMLNVSHTITRVSLRVNAFGDEGARALADVIKNNVSVTDIDLSENSIGAEGAIALAEALKVNTVVTSIDLSENSIGAEGARALAEALKVNTVVTSIDLSENSIGAEGAIALAEALKSNSKIEIIGFHLQ